MGTMTKPQYKGKRYRLDKPELLAPAGNLEKLKFAVHYGADAVYIGGQQYGLRSGADNFSFEEMREGVEFAKKYGAKVFVATNIYAHNEDVAGIEEYLRNLYEAGIAAIIVADPIIVDTARRLVPGLEVHLSTQQSTLNWQAVSFWKEEGLPRVVLVVRQAWKRLLRLKNMSTLKSKASSMVPCAPHIRVVVYCPTISPTVIPIAGAVASLAVGNMICLRMHVRKGLGCLRKSRLKRNLQLLCFQV